MIEIIFFYKSKVYIET